MGPETPAEEEACRAQAAAGLGDTSVAKELRRVECCLPSGPLKAMPVPATASPRTKTVNAAAREVLVRGPIGVRVRGCGGLGGMRAQRRSQRRDCAPRSQARGAARRRAPRLRAGSAQNHRRNHPACLPCRRRCS